MTDANLSDVVTELQGLRTDVQTLGARLERAEEEEGVKRAPRVF